MAVPSLGNEEITIMREQITIDVTRTMGSRYARVRVFVAPTGGDAGVHYTAGSVDLGSSGHCDRELGASIASAVMDMIERQVEFHQMMLEM